MSNQYSTGPPKEGGSSSETHKIDQKQIDFSSDFEKVLHSAGFVDKTLLIKTFLSGCGEMTLMTIPRKFGKSTNADMLKRFLAIQVDENGNRIPNEKSSNYRLFTSPIPGTDPPCELKISREKEIIQLGNYPVIYLKFHCDTINSVNDAEAAYKTIVHEAFKDHEYLCNSPKLKEFGLGGDVELCAKWCSETEHMSFDRFCASNALRDLSCYLYRHHEKQAIVICDDYDVMVTSSMFHVESSVLKKIMDIFMYPLHSLCKGNEYVDSVFITGTFHLQCSIHFCMSALDHIYRYSFLEGPYWSYYGLTMQELEMLKKRFSLEDEEFNNMVEYYNGYSEFGNRNVFNPYSIMSYLKNRQFDNYWCKLGAMTNLSNALKNPHVERTVFGMISGTDETFVISRPRWYSVDEFKFIVEPKDEQSRWFSEKLLPFMLQHGYFIICETKKDLPLRDRISIKIPNKEIRLEFIEKLKEIHRVGGVDYEYRRKFQKNL